jgi:hypothetical protein
MSEKRRIQRTQVLKGAKIIFGNRSCLLDCVVKNLTNSGARLELPSLIGIPPSFELSFDQGRIMRSCRVMWQKGNNIGVSFGGAANPALPNDQIEGQ